MREEWFVPRHACFLAQQSAEKALKAALTFLPDDWEIRNRHPDLAELTEWAVEARYPGDWPDATVEGKRGAHLRKRAACSSA